MIIFKCIICCRQSIAGSIPLAKYKLLFNQNHFSDYEYTLEEGKWCQPYKSEYSTHLEARKNCNIDPGCKMFYEIGGSEGFVLCGDDAEVKPSSYNSRLYVKNG